MKKKTRKFNLVKWTVRGAAVLSVPVMLRSAIPVENQMTWLGAVVVWLFLGRIIEGDRRGERE